MSVSFILAMDRNRGIGFNNKLPWRMPADLAYFKRVTMGHTILMGRKTYESIGKPLPGRHNVILTQNREYRAEGCTIVHSVEEALDRFARNEELFVTGGGEIFKLFLPYADKLYITYIEETFPADAFFPEVNEGEWRLVCSEQGVRDEKNPYEYYFRIYEKK
jgi:dihydrofolate reductase